jgi:hypothetical protein
MTTRLRLIALGATLAAATLLFGNATAHAVCDTTCKNQAFIDTLNILGVGTQYTDESRIAVAHQVCTGYDSGYVDFETFLPLPPVDLVTRVQQRGSKLAGLRAA